MTARKVIWNVRSWLYCEVAILDLTMLISVDTWTIGIISGAQISEPNGYVFSKRHSHSWYRFVFQVVYVGLFSVVDTDLTGTFDPYGDRITTDLWHVQTHHTECGGNLPPWLHLGLEYNFTDVDTSTDVLMKIPANRLQIGYRIV